MTAEEFSSPLVNLGEQLFFDNRLSRDADLACASCHRPEMGTADNHIVSTGARGHRGNRNTPVIFNLVFAGAVMLDGRAKDIDSQPILPLEAANEMNVSWPEAIRIIGNDPQVLDVLQKLGVRVLDRTLVVRALSEYVKSLVAGNSRFDRFYFGKQNDTLKDDEKAGLALFLGKANCSSCHLVSSDFALFTDSGFHALGTRPTSTSADLGRFLITGLRSQRGAFKTPTLRNVSKTGPYMHDGRFASLEEVVRFYSDGGGTGVKDSQLQRLDLSAAEQKQLVLFLYSLDCDVVSYRPIQ